MEQRELGTIGIRISTVALGRMSRVHNETCNGIAVDQAIPWLIHQKAVTSVLAGASMPDHARANAVAARVRLSDDVLERLHDVTRIVMLRIGASLDMWDGTSRIR